jgi:hypothetical protein
MITTLLATALINQYAMQEYGRRGLPAELFAEFETLAILKPEQVLARITVEFEGKTTPRIKLWIQFDRMKVLSSNTVTPGESIVVGSLIPLGDERKRDADTNVFVIGRRTRDGRFQVAMAEKWRYEDVPRGLETLDIDSDLNPQLYAYGVFETKETQLIQASDYKRQIQWNLLDSLKRMPENVDEVLRGVSLMPARSDSRELSSNASVEPDDLSRRIWEVAASIPPEQRVALLGYVVRRQSKGSVDRLLLALMEHPNVELRTLYHLTFDVPTDKESWARFQGKLKVIAFATQSTSVFAQCLQDLNRLNLDERQGLAHWLDHPSRSGRLTFVKWLHRHYGGKGVTGWEAPDLDEAVAYWKGVLGR